MSEVDLNIGFMGPEMNHHLIASPYLPLSGFEGQTYDGLFQRYSNSEYGLHHAQQPPRYSNVYAYAPERMLADLGKDVHPVEHMRHTHDEIQVRLMYVQNCLADGYEFEQFTPAEIITGRLTPLFHDMGECEHPSLETITGRVVGDIAWGTKSSEDESVETAIRQHIYGELYSDIPGELLEMVEESISHSGNSLTAESFAATERIGYYLTALRAGYLALLEHYGRQSDKEGRDDHEFSMLSALAKQVTDNHRQALAEQGERFPFAGMIVQENKILDDLIHSEL